MRSHMNKGEYGTVHLGYEFVEWVEGFLLAQGICII